MFPSMDAYREQARQVHGVLLKIASSESLQIGFPSSRVALEAYEKLKSMNFRKPFFSPKIEWTRRAIIFEPKVYEFLWPHVELEFIVDGTIRFFTGVGVPRRSNVSLLHLDALLPDKYWCINCGFNFNLFSSCFENLTKR